MGLRAYTCNLWKELRIGKYVKFVGCEFETDDPELQALIESNNAFGSAIHYKDTLEEMEEKSRLRAEEIAANKARRRQQLLDEIAEEDRIGLTRPPHSVQRKPVLRAPGRPRAAGRAALRRASRGSKSSGR